MKAKSKTVYYVSPSEDTVGKIKTTGTGMIGEAIFIGLGWKKVTRSKYLEVKQKNREKDNEHTRK